MLTNRSLFASLLLPLLLITACAMEPSALPQEKSIVPIQNLVKWRIQAIAQPHRLRIIIPFDPFFQIHSYQSKQRLVHAMPEIVALIHKYPSYLPILVVGNTDNIVNPLQRNHLSALLANNVAALLWQHGIAPHRLHRIAFSTRTTIANNNTPYGNRMNRRVEILIGYRNPRVATDPYFSNAY